MKYEREVRIAAPVEEVFAFHESPGALELLTPPWETMKVVESSRSLQPGSRVVLRGRVGPLPVTWVAVHTEYDPPRLFADRQESGPFTTWYHRHRFSDTGDGGTLLRDELEYTLPMGALGRWLAGGMVRNKLERMFDYRHEVTKELVESGSWRDQPPTAAP